jgi:DNA-binding winged helix-turn-helix (wHTH) protein/TolB-like protein/tetratricopeptide (TPR) repeat protein
MSEQKAIYQFSDFQLDLGEKQLRRLDGEVLPLPPKAFDILALLVENRGRLLEKNEVMDQIWADSFVEEGNLKIHIHRLRKTLNDHHEEFIETVPRRGYRFNGNVQLIEKGELIIEKITQAKLVIEETHEPRPLLTGKSRTFWFDAVVVVAGLALGAAVLLITHRLNRAEPASASLNTIAVLPFSYIGEKQSDDEYLQEGLPDALITRLSYQPKIKIRPTSATRKYLNANADSRTVGRELGVDAVLEGTIRREGDRIRVNLQLVRVADGVSIWSETFNDEQRSLIALEERIAGRVVSTLSAKLNPDLKNAPRPTANEDAYDAYLKGRFFWNKRTDEGYAKATAEYEKAIAADPNFALAYTGLADIDAFATPNSEVAIKAENYARKAIELNSALAEPHATLGFIYCFHKWDWQRSEAEFKQSLALNQNYATAHHWYSIMLVIQKRYAEAEGEMRKALEIDPLSLAMNSDLCQTFYFARRYDEAINQCRKTLELDGQSPNAHGYLRDALEQKQMKNELLADLKETSNADDPYVRAVASGDLHRYHQLEIAIEQKNADYDAVTIAKNYALIGDKDQSLHWLDRAWQTHNFMFPFVNVDPAFDGERDEPRFIDLLRNTGLGH